MASHVYAGKDLGTLDLTITEEMVQHYTQGLDEPNPWYTDDSPFGGPVVPVIIFQDLAVCLRGGIWTICSAIYGCVRPGTSMPRYGWGRRYTAVPGWQIATANAIVRSSPRKC